MSSKYINKSDFTGEIKISQNTKEVNTLQYYIDRYEKIILTDLIGDLQYNAYLDQLDSTTKLSKIPKYKVLLTGKNFQSFHNYNTATQFYYYNQDDIYTSYYGMITSIKYFIYWYFVRDLRAKVTSVGIKFPFAELSTDPMQNEINSVIEQRYNEAVTIYQEAYAMLHDLKDIKVHFLSQNIIDNGDDTYTIKLIQLQKNSFNLAQLINTSDIIKLGSKEYFVLSNDFTTVPTEAQITFAETSGKTFEETHFTIDPYFKLRSKRKELSVLDGLF